MRTPLFSLLALALIACSGDKEPADSAPAVDDTSVAVDDTGSADDTSAADDTGETGEPIDTSPVVEDPDLAPFDITAEVSEHVVTVITVRWSTPEPSVGYVEFGETASYGHTTALTEASTEHEVLLLGMPSETEVNFRVVSLVPEDVDAGITDDPLALSGDHTITTGILPVELPTLIYEGAPAADRTFQIAPLQGISYMAVILDDQGRYVWYSILEPGYNLMRAEVSHDRESVLICQAGTGGNDSDGTVLRVSMDGSERTEYEFPYIDHDLVELPDGTVGAIVNVRNEGYAAEADAIQELAPDGTITEVWNAWTDPAMAPHMPEPWETEAWTHGNALDYVPEQDAYYISMVNIGMLAKIDRSTGETQWLMWGPGNEFEVTSGEAVVRQHQLHVFDDRILIFDNGTQERQASRAVEFIIDEEARTLEQAWEFYHDPSLYVYSKGDVQRVGEDTIITWSTSGELQRVNPAGDVVWQINTELGHAFTFTQVLDDLYLRE